MKVGTKNIIVKKFGNIKNYSYLCITNLKTIKKMENLKTSKLINFVTFLTSLFVVMVITFPIANELDSIISNILLIIIVCVGIISLDITLKRKIYEFIHSEVKRHKYKHVNEFFDYIEDDRQFANNVLRQTIPIKDDDNKEIGTQTVYSALSSKRNIFQHKN